MIVINLDFAISLFFSIILLLVIGSWLRYTIDERKETRKSGDAVQCPYCGYVFLDFFKKEIITCPRCESYIEEKKMIKNHIPVKKENKGTVLVTVVMLILAMMALAVGILSAIGSQGLLGQNQVDRIKAEQLAKGLFWKVYYERASTSTPSSGPYTETLDGKLYTGTVTLGAQIAPGSDLGNTFPVSSTVTYLP